MILTVYMYNIVMYSMLTSFSREETILPSDYFIYRTLSPALTSGNMGNFISKIHVVPMSMETTGRQVGNLKSWISDNLYYFLISFNL